MQLGRKKIDIIIAMNLVIIIQVQNQSVKKSMIYNKDN